MLFTDWRGDADERLDRRPGTELGAVLAGCAAARRRRARAGVALAPRPGSGSASRRPSTSPRRSTRPAARSCSTSGCAAAGSHHQKLVLLRHPGPRGGDVAFVGGIDLCHGRRDDERHRGDPQAPSDRRPVRRRPPWHDVQLEVRGPAVGDLAHTFRERWDDPTPLDHRNPWRALLARAPASPAPRAAPAEPADPAGGRPRTRCRSCAPIRPSARRTRSPRRASAASPGPTPRRSAGPAGSIYVEDQYLWSAEVARRLRRRPAGRRPTCSWSPWCRATPEPDGAAVRSRRAASATSRRSTMLRTPAATGSRSTTSRTTTGTPDLRPRQGLRRRRRVGHDRLRQPQPAVVDPRLRAVAARCSTPTRDEREPADPGGRGDGARRFARDLRLRLCRRAPRPAARRPRPARPGRRLPRLRGRPQWPWIAGTTGGRRGTAPARPGAASTTRRPCPGGRCTRAWPTGPSSTPTAGPGVSARPATSDHMPS